MKARKELNRDMKKKKKMKKKKEYKSDMPEITEFKEMFEGFRLRYDRTTPYEKGTRDYMTNNKKALKKIKKNKGWKNYQKKKFGWKKKVPYIYLSHRLKTAPASLNSRIWMEKVTAKSRLTIPTMTTTSPNTPMRMCMKSRRTPECTRMVDTPMRRALLRSILIMLSILNSNFNWGFTPNNFTSLFGRSGFFLNAIYLPFSS